jgi:hypothetical protein
MPLRRRITPATPTAGVTCGWIGSCPLGTVLLLLVPFFSLVLVGMTLESVLVAFAFDATDEAEVGLDDPPLEVMEAEPLDEAEPGDVTVAESDPCVDVGVPSTVPVVLTAVVPSLMCSTRAEAEDMNAAWKKVRPYTKQRKGLIARSRCS